MTATLARTWHDLQELTRAVDLLRNDIRSAFDGLDTQARSLSALSDRVDTGFKQVSDRITEIDQAHTALHNDDVGRIARLEQRHADHNLVHTEMWTAHAQLHAKQHPAKPPAVSRSDWAQRGDPAESMDEVEARRSMETAAERGDRPPERGETITVTCLQWALNGNQFCSQASNLRGREHYWCASCRQPQSPLIDRSAQHRRETEVQDRAPRTPELPDGGG